DENRSGRRRQRYEDEAGGGDFDFGRRDRRDEDEADDYRPRRKRRKRGSGSFPIGPILGGIAGLALAAGVIVGVIFLIKALASGGRHEFHSAEGKFKVVFPGAPKQERRNVV